MKNFRIHLAVAIICAAATTAVFCLNKQRQSISTSPAATGPLRIASLAPNLTEILFALGLEEKIVAVSDDSDYPAAAETKKKTGTFWQPNTESVIASRPNLIITLWFEQQKSVADYLTHMGYQVLTLRMEKIEELLESIEKIGSATDRKQQADELSKSIKNQMDNLQAKVSSAEKVKVLWVLQNEPLCVAGRDTFINELIELTGGENAIGPTLQQYPPLGTEKLLKSGAEVIIQSAMGPGDIRKQQRNAETFWKKYPNLPAVKKNRIYVIDSDIILRLGPRLPDGAKIIARCLHPDIFEESQTSLKEVK